MPCEEELECSDVPLIVRTLSCLNTDDQDSVEQLDVSLMVRSLLNAAVDGLVPSPAVVASDIVTFFLFFLVLFCGRSSLFECA